MNEIDICIHVDLYIGNELRKFVFIEFYFRSIYVGTRNQNVHLSDYYMSRIDYSQ
jgi:hypothetical protein